jgi:hypothetical protein
MRASTRSPDIHAQAANSSGVVPYNARYHLSSRATIGTVAASSPWYIAENSSITAPLAAVPASGMNAGS